MNMRYFILCLLFLLFSTRGQATHIVGGEFSYVYLGDTLIGNTEVSNYRVSLSIYEDCLNGLLSAIKDDNPAYISIFNNDRTLTDNYFLIDTTLNYSSSVSVPINFSNLCVANIPPTCLFKKTFTRSYYLPHNSYGYVISYQRCCRNCSIGNVLNPCSSGSTFYCTIPAWPVTNNSAVFKNYPPQIICLYNPLFYDNSATDADGDSLSYEFCTSLTCCEGVSANSKPIPTQPSQFPPLFYDSVTYKPGFSSSVPMTGFPPIVIDPVTGLISGTPNLQNRYLVTVCCNEWRHGLLINTNKREFQFVVTPCTKKVVADIPEYSSDPNTYIVDCKDYTVNFVNTSTGGFSYLWNFGVPGIYSDTSNQFEPSFTYPDTGTFTVDLIVNPNSTCPDSISRFVKIYPKFLADFTDTGILCMGDTIHFIDKSSASIKPITYWKWNFGDGDSSLIQNPLHSFKNGGEYNVTLISKNIKNCIDTSLKQLLIENFKPFAGNDTIIVKGESITFDAIGGIQYLWSPGENLSSTTIYNPVGYFPDTGLYTYYVQMKSAFGCVGEDTLQVRVVNQAEFMVPTAFSPNGDGLNDVFKPIAAGYKSINYFFVFNRWGQKVYSGNSFEEGWDGTFNGVKADLGVYFWEISFIDRFGKQGFLKGDVTLMR